MILIGPAGIGKRHFADRFAAALMCTNTGAEGQPCGVCADCVLLSAGTHPDLIHLDPDPESKSNEIKIDAVRELCNRQSLTANRGPRTVLRIAPAEAMNRFAANSLLKTLEEPADSTLLILISENPGGLPSTVISRCQPLTMLPPDAENAERWLSAKLNNPEIETRLLLRLAQDAPLRALVISNDHWLTLRDDCFRRFQAIAMGDQDPLAAASAWQQLDVELLLEWLAGWVSDLLRIGQNGDCAYLNNPDRRTELTILALRLVPLDVHLYLQQVLKAKALSALPINKLLLFESLLVRWARLSAGIDLNGN
ncbi:MAG: hypothetical protein N838_21545 [Thiohalocapsa sp. PB-PSB1]|nr:MAG: hypothetical protein N838_21545 [Thiohalocapsa sp. PB-PSB1]